MEKNNTRSSVVKRSSATAKPISDISSAALSAAGRSRRGSSRPITADTPCWISSLTNAMEADLSVTPFEMKAEDGRVFTGNTYAVTSVDPETGEILFL